MGTSGWAMMTRPPVQLMSAIPPWRGMRSFSQQPIEVGGTATVFSIPWFFLYAPLVNKIAKGTFHCGAG